MIYLGQWEWVLNPAEIPHWRVPGGSGTGCLDLRSLPQMALAGGLPQGWGLFVYDAPQVHPLLEVELGDDPSAVLNTSPRRELSNRLTGFTSTRLIDILRELLLDDPASGKWDATGQTKWKPIRGSSRSGVKLVIPSLGVMIDEAFSLGHEAFATTRDVFRADYRRHKQYLGTLAGRERDDFEQTLRRFAGAELLKVYQRFDPTNDAASLLPPEFADDVVERPRTSISDPFTNTDTTKLASHSAAGFSWTEVAVGGGTGDLEIASNEVFPTNNGYPPVPVARADSDLSSDDHYSQIDVTTLVEPPSGTYETAVGALARFSASATTFYQLFIIYQGSGGGTYLRFDKCVSGTFTNDLPSSQPAVSLSLPDPLRIHCDASTMKAFYDGTEELSFSDASITGNLRAGVSGFQSAVSADSDQVFDNFLAADLAAGAASIPKGVLKALQSIKRTGHY